MKLSADQSRFGEPLVSETGGLSGALVLRCVGELSQLSAVADNTCVMLLEFSRCDGRKISKFLQVMKERKTPEYGYLSTIMRKR